MNENNFVHTAIDDMVAPIKEEEDESLQSKISNQSSFGNNIGIPMRNEGLNHASKTTDHKKPLSFINVNGMLMKKPNKSRRSSIMSDVKSASEDKNIRSNESSIKDLNKHE